MTRFIVTTALILLSIASPRSQTAEAEDILVYVYQKDCGACMKFDKEVAPLYPNTTEAQRLPMVKVSLEDWQSGQHPFQQCRVGEVFGTPTFVQLHNCAEIDRITGYSSDELFWLGLTRMHNKVAEPG